MVRPAGQQVAKRSGGPLSSHSAWLGGGSACAAQAPAADAAGGARARALAGGRRGRRCWHGGLRCSTPSAIPRQQPTCCRATRRGGRGGAAGPRSTSARAAHRQSCCAAAADGRQGCRPLQAWRRQGLPWLSASCRPDDEPGFRSGTAGSAAASRAPGAGARWQMQPERLRAQRRCGAPGTSSTAGRGALLAQLGHNNAWLAAGAWTGRDGRAAGRGGVSWGLQGGGAQQARRAAGGGPPPDVPSPAKPTNNKGFGDADVLGPPPLLFPCFGPLGWRGACRCFNNLGQ